LRRPASRIPQTSGTAAGRGRGIPGWHEGGNSANVERRLAEFPPWTGEVLSIDAIQPLAQNLASVLKYVTD
jgi:hypothetical protein